MLNWKIVSKIAMFSGIIILVFSAIAAFTTYELIAIQYKQYGTVAPMNVIEFNVLYAMLPYLLFAIIAFIISAVASRAIDESVQKQALPEMEPETQPTEITPEVTNP